MVKSNKPKHGGKASIKLNLPACQKMATSCQKMAKFK